MFVDYCNSQFIAYSLLNNAIKKDRLSHAYLIDGNNCDYAFDFVMAFVKEIICNDVNSNEEKEIICSRIDDDNYPEVKIIDSSSLIIKKEQMIDLQSIFSLKAIEGKKRIYIIKDCEKMNKQAANCMLKFLEEPSDNIIAILFTNSVNSLLPTIISRCQMIRLSNDFQYDNSKAIYNFACLFCDKKDDVISFINDESKIKMINDVICFIKYFENYKLDIFIDIKKLWYNNFSSKEEVSMALSLILNFYNDVLKKKAGLSNYFFNDYIDLIDDISLKNSVDEILYKIDVCYNKYDILKYNLNINLCIDDFFIRLGDYNECC